LTPECAFTQAVTAGNLMGMRGRISLAIICIIMTISILAPYVTPYDPNAVDLDSLKLPPSAEHPFGTDQKGRDIFTRVIYGGRISISVSLAAAILSLSIGMLVGLVSGYFGGWVDTSVMAIVDLVLSFPSLLLAIGVSLVMPPGIYTVMFAIAAVSWASFARLIRGHVLSIKGLPYIEAAKAIGSSSPRVIFVHLLPQCLPLGLVMMGLKVGGFILIEASLSFLGLGAQPPTASWGAMINAGRAYIVVSHWMVLFPGLAIALTTLCFNTAGDALSERFGIKSSLDIQ